MDFGRESPLEFTGVHMEYGGTDKTSKTGPNQFEPVWTESQ